METLRDYEAIMKLGLKGVEWTKLNISGGVNFYKIFEEARDFLDVHRPCLFIWEPRDENNGLKKGYVMGLEDIRHLQDWIYSNEGDLDEYSYVMTSQIINPRGERGFIGSVFSDGFGNMIGESYHRPGVFDQRELSRPGEDFDLNYLNRFSVANFELLGVHAGSEGNLFLGERDFSELIETYSPLKGYFEFIRGSQDGKIGIYTTGFKDNGLFKFPRELHELEFRNLNGRIEALNIRNGKI